MQLTAIVQTGENKTAYPAPAYEKESENFNSYLDKNQKQASLSAKDEPRQLNEKEHPENRDQKSRETTNRQHEENVNPLPEENKTESNRIIKIIRQELLQKSTNLISIPEQPATSETEALLPNIISSQLSGSRNSSLATIVIQNMETRPSVNLKSEIIQPLLNQEKLSVEGKQPAETKQKSELPPKHDSIQEFHPELKTESRPRLANEKNSEQFFSLTLNEHRLPLKIVSAEVNFNQPPQPVNVKVLQAVQEAIQFLWQKGEDKIVLRLFPPELGRVQIEMIKKDQSVEIKINTENQTVRELIINNAEQLKQNLQSSGVQLKNFEVNLGNFKDFFLNSNQNQQQTSKHQSDLLPDYGRSENGSQQFTAEESRSEQRLILLKGRVNILI